MIELQALCRDFAVGDQIVHALDHIDLRIEPGDYVSVMGPSGSGKSTLLNMIGLLDRPSSGNYLLNDRNVTELDEREQAAVRNRKIGFVFQAFHLVPRLTAAENIELPLILAGEPPGQRRDKVASALAALRLEDRAHHKPEQLSGGQRQRVAIARATINAPAVLLADEPTGNLDRQAGQEVIETLEQLNRDGISLIVVTHDPDIGNRARRQVKMIDGRIDQDRPRAD